MAIPAQEASSMTMRAPEPKAKPKKNHQKTIERPSNRTFVLMVIIWSGIGITNGKGILGGTVLSGNSAGRMASNYRKPISRYEPTQMLQRNRFQTAVASWNDITDSQRAGWNAATATGDWDTTNSLGETIRPSGYQLFLRLNLSLAPADTSISTAPSKPTLSPPLLTAVTATAPSTISLTFDSGSIGGSEHMLIFATRSLSPGIFSPRHSDYIFIDIIDSGSFSSTPNISTAYTAIFGKLIADCSIFVSATLLDGSSGDRASAGLIRDIIS